MFSSSSSINVVPRWADEGSILNIIIWIYIYIYIHIHKLITKCPYVWLLSKLQNSLLYIICIKLYVYSICYICLVPTKARPGELFSIMSMIIDITISINIIHSSSSSIVIIIVKHISTMFSIIISSSSMIVIHIVCIIISISMVISICFIICADEGSHHATRPRWMIRKGGWYSWTPSSSSNLSFRAFRVPIAQRAFRA